MCELRNIAVSSVDLTRTSWDRVRGSVTYSEYMTGMSVKKQTGRNRKLIPEFVNNEAQFRSVLVHATVKYVFRQAAIPKDIATDLENLKRLADDRTGKMRSQIEVSNKYWNSMSKHLRAVHDVGGYMQMISTAATDTPRAHCARPWLSDIRAAQERRYSAGGRSGRRCDC